MLKAKSSIRIDGDCAAWRVVIRGITVRSPVDFFRSDTILLRMTFGQRSRFFHYLNLFQAILRLLNKLGHFSIAVVKFNDAPPNFFRRDDITFLKLFIGKA